MTDVKIFEMAPRDGFQILNSSGRIPLDRRVEIINILLKAGFPYLEIGSFVGPGMVSMRDSADVVAAVASAAADYRGRLAALVPNLTGYERFARCREKAPHLNMVGLFVSASDDYSRKNTKMTIEQAMAAASEVAAAASTDGLPLRAHVSGAFRQLDSANTATDEGVVIRLFESLVEMGCEVVALADTDGRATRQDIERVLSALQDDAGTLDRVAVHLHDRFGNAVRNASVAFDLGVRGFDSAVGGIGGNQTVPDSPGNVATDELVHMFEQDGIKTGIDTALVLSALERIRALAREFFAPAPPSKLSPPLNEYVVREYAIR